MKIQAYLCFEGRCEEALGLYKEVFGAEVQALMRFKESPEPCSDGAVAPGSENKILHASFRIGDTELMATDGSCTGKAQFQGIALTAPCRDEAQAQRLFEGLSKGGQVQMPLGKTFFSPCFGMVADKFGVSWMVIVQP